VTCVVTDAQTLLQKQVLHPCSGIAVPGETMALMGPSGAGKSTLLDLLAGRKAVGRLGGGVLMNGRPCGTLFKRISAYVAQEDVFVPTMTATETLVFHATLTLPSAVDSTEREARIADVLRLMGLWRARHTQVGGALPGGILVRGLSGGEKRRLNIGCALIASPSLLFLDEPTTGLDSFAALNVMEHMRDLAGMGHTVIASIHQPRAAIWEMFHRVTVLSEGYQLYFGRPEDARAWFGDALGYDYELGRDGAVSDWMMDLVSVGFAKPPDYAGRSMACVADVVAAYRAFQRERPPVTDAVLRTVSTLPASGMKSLAAHTAVSVTAAVAAARASSAAGVVGGAPSLTGGGPFAGRASTADGYGVATRVSSTAGGGALAAPAVDLRVAAGGSAMDRLRSEALAEVAAKSPKAVTDRLQWASGRYAASWWTQFRTLFKRAVLAQLRNPTDATSRLLLATWVGMLGGLVFFNLPVGPEAVQKRLAVLFFTLLLFELVPFCYMSFYVEDRRFFAADVASDLYHPR
jgi:ATP-binding cassette subfamily G (WHITE) protein 2